MPRSRTLADALQKMVKKGLPVSFGCSVPVVLLKVDENYGGGFLFVEEAYILWEDGW